MNWRLFSVILLFSSPVSAQIVPDSTKGSLISPNSLIYGGAARGSNLFHSFTEFNVNSGGRIYFNPGADINNIFTRVTGKNLSNINGTLGVFGDANLIFMNPNGIVFGSSAALDLKGSFLATTASNILFSDKSVFSSDVNSAPAPLLTQSVPVGLGFGSSPSAITLNGAGHQLTTTSTPVVGAAPLTGNATGLEVQPFKSLILAGGDINLNGGVLKAPGGNVELTSVGAFEVVNLNGFTLDNGDVKSFQNIQLQNRALVDVSGGQAGSIKVSSRQVNIRDGSVLLVQNRGSQNAGSIYVNAVESLSLSGTTPDGKVVSTLLNETLGTGKGGDIAVSTQKLSILHGASLSNKTFGDANSGKVSVNASESIHIAGFTQANPSQVSILGARTFSAGNAGDVTISTGKLSVNEGAVVTASSFGRGSGGNLLIDAKSILVNGRRKYGFAVCGFKLGC
jgi:filamentous hemagglutinin family protein